MSCKITIKFIIQMSIHITSMLANDDGHLLQKKFPSCQFRYWVKIIQHADECNMIYMIKHEMPV